MELRLSAAQVRLRQEAEAFCREILPLIEAESDLAFQGMPSDGDSRVVYRRLGEAGWIGLHWPKEVGGRGLSLLETAAVEEVFGYYWLPLSPYLLSCRTVGTALLRFGPEPLARRLLPAICRGELIFCQGFSEPEAGSDLASLKTTACQVPGGFVVNGRKVWTSSAQVADWLYLTVRTDPEAPKHRGLSVLVLPMDSPGITIRPIPTLGGGVLNEVILSDVFVPREYLVGELNGGWAVILYTLDYERVTIEKVGVLARVLDELKAALGGMRPDSSWRLELSELEGALRAARLLCYRAAWHLARGEPASVPSAMAKLAVGRLVKLVASVGLDLLGPAGLIEAGPLARLRGRAAALYRAAVGSTIAGGTAEIQRLIIARRGLGCPG